MPLPSPDFFRLIFFLKKKESIFYLCDQVDDDALSLVGSCSRKLHSQRGCKERNVQSGFRGALETEYTAQEVAVDDETQLLLDNVVYPELDQRLLQTASDTIKLLDVALLDSVDKPVKETTQAILLDQCRLWHGPSQHPHKDQEQQDFSAPIS